MQRLVSYFTDGVTSRTLQTVGTEIETQFVDKGGKPITTALSQQMFYYLVQHRWNVVSRKGDLITALADYRGNRISYELSRHNIEVATIASSAVGVLAILKKCLGQLYEAAGAVGAAPHFAPLLEGGDDLLVIPDERDAVWLELDGQKALAPLARTSAVQFTISLTSRESIRILNRLGEHINSFLADYPQDVVWRRYIAESSAEYLPSRYGGPLIFDGLPGYCRALAEHDVVQGTQLVPYNQVVSLDIPLYLRSIWWHFRLKRYGNALCVEVRPLARRMDEAIPRQLEKVLNIICG